MLFENVADRAIQVGDAPTTVTDEGVSRRRNLDGTEVINRAS
jgi:hypothetical protein